MSLDDELETEDNLNFFKFDPEYELKERQWDEIKKEILGEYADVMVKQREAAAAEEEAKANEDPEQAVGVPLQGVMAPGINYQKVSELSLLMSIQRREVLLFCHQLLSLDSNLLFFICD